MKPNASYSDHVSKLQKGRTNPGGAAREPEAQAANESMMEEGLESVSALQILDRVKAELATQGMAPSMPLLRHRIVEMEELQDQARMAVEKLNEAVEKLRAPALRLGTLLQKLAKGRALVCANGTDYVCNVDPALPEGALETGSAGAAQRGLRRDRRFRLRQKRAGGAHHRDAAATAACAWATKRASRTPWWSAPSLLSEGETEGRPGSAPGHATSGWRSKSSAGPNGWTGRSPVWNRFPGARLAGSTKRCKAIRDSHRVAVPARPPVPAVQAPGAQRFSALWPARLRQDAAGQSHRSQPARCRSGSETGEDRPEFFLSVKGPEILNMWLGESERQVRDLFAQCREKAAEGHLAFLFIDEAESILGTRHAVRVGTNILSTLVPMFCTEMDGLEPLQNVVVILASNRADLIDPAILRPGRIDRKIRVRRPDKEAAREIYRIYLTEICRWRSRAERWWTRSSKRTTPRSRTTGSWMSPTAAAATIICYRGDLASGAIIAAIVERAKESAIKRSIERKTESPITLQDLLEALDKEYRENDLFPPSDITEDWLKLTDFEPGNVVRLSPYRPSERGQRLRSPFDPSCAPHAARVPKPKPIELHHAPRDLDIQFGIETEIGITRERPEDLDVVAESIALVRCATAPGVRRCAGITSCEDPHCDARGFRVKELLQDHDEANYFAQDAQRRLSIRRVQSDLVLRNGARFYNDHAHPEYCTPECSTLLEHPAAGLRRGPTSDGMRPQPQPGLGQPGAALQKQHRLSAGTATAATRIT